MAYRTPQLIGGAVLAWIVLASLHEVVAGEELFHLHAFDFGSQDRPSCTFTASDLQWPGGRPPASAADGFRFDGRHWAVLAVSEGLGHTVDIRLECTIDQGSDGIGGTLVSAVDPAAPRQILWALRIHGERLELVRKLDEVEGRPRYRSVFSRDPIRVGQPLNVQVRLEPGETALTVDGFTRWTSTYFGAPSTNRLVLGGEGEHGPALRRFVGRIASIRMETRRHQPLRIDTWNRRPVVLVEVPQGDERFGRGPIRLEMYAHRLREAWPGTRNAAIADQLRVYRWDDHGRQVRGEALPARVEVDPGSDAAIIGWVPPDLTAGTYALVLDEQGTSWTEPMSIPLVGVGEPVSVGRTDLTAHAGQLLASYPAVVDWDLDGDLDLLVASVIPRRIWLFENIADSDSTMPTLIAPRPVYDGKSFLTFDLIQLADGRIQILQAVKGKQALELWRDEMIDGDRSIQRHSTIELTGLPKDAHLFDVHLCDIDQDGVPDLLLSVWEGNWWWPDGIDPWNQGRGNPKTGYGRGYDETGRWLGEPPIGSFWMALNRGTAEDPAFDTLRPLTAGGEPIRLPTTQLAATLVDVDGDGDLDLLAAVGVDQLMIFEKRDGQPLSRDYALPRNALRDTQVSKWSYFDTRFELVDWNRDGRQDLLMGSNPGLIVLGRFEQGKLVEDSILKARGGHVWAETLVVPVIDDVDGDGKWDILMGDSSGFLSLFRNTGQAMRPLFPERKKLPAGGTLFRPVAGYAGSIQGPNEARWGYLAPTLGDWDGDGRKDVIASDITGFVYWLRNSAGAGEPQLQAPEPLTVDTWPLKVRWRTRPALVPGDASGLPRLVMTDEHGYLCLYEREPMHGPSALRPGRRILNEAGSPIKLDGPGGYNGRTKLLATDWDRDGRWDLLIGQPARAALAPEVEFSLVRHRKATVVFLRNMGSAEEPRMAAPQLLTLADGTWLEFGNHSCAPAVYDVDGDGWDDLFIGAETGFVHYYHRSLFEDAARIIRVY